MSTEETKGLMGRYFEALMKDKSDATVDQYVTDENLKQHIRMFEAAFPGYQLSAEDMVVEGDRVAIRSIMTGIHQGELMGILPTGKQVSVPLMVFYRVAGGKITEFWINADTLGLLQQLGAIPAPASVTG
jgi:predicted ester cyclase